ncbi:MAG: hypothetical protein LBH04_05520 [Tannerellaceae bacterium]|nr:hypothetical protein [Tannerellaceae bacterium]
MNKAVRWRQSNIQQALSSILPGLWKIDGDIRTVKSKASNFKQRISREIPGKSTVFFPSSNYENSGRKNMKRLHSCKSFLSKT